MAKSKSRSPQSSKSRLIPLLVILLISSVVGGLLFEDYREVPYGWFITILWLVVAAFSCAFGVIYYAQFVLPHHLGENWLEGIAMMARAATYLGPVAPQAGQGQSADRLSPSFQTLGAGMLRSHQALSVGKGESFLRAAGPGFVRLQPGERPLQLVDLRRHARTAEAVANTRDGIPVASKVAVVFQVKQSEQDHQGDNLAYPYDKSAVFWVTQLKTFDQDDVVHIWSDQIAPQAATYMISEVAQFTLDELWQDPSIFRGIQDRIRRQLRSNFDEWGIVIHNVKVVPQEIPEQIAEQRLENWRAAWQNQIEAQTAATQAEAQRRMRSARARAQVDMIAEIMRSINETQRTADASLPEIVTLRIIDVLEDAATRQASETFLLPSHVPAPTVDGAPPIAETGKGNDDR